MHILVTDVLADLKFTMHQGSKDTLHCSITKKYQLYLILFYLSELLKARLIIQLSCCHWTQPFLKSEILNHLKWKWNLTELYLACYTQLQDQKILAIIRSNITSHRYKLPKSRLVHGRRGLFRGAESHFFGWPAITHVHRVHCHGGFPSEDTLVTVKQKNLD